MSTYGDAFVGAGGDEAVPRNQITSTLFSSPPVFQQPTSLAYEVQVCNPQKQNDKSRAYVAYTLRVKKLKDGVETSTFRRYSDFLWIHDNLLTKYPSCVIPPMPEKALTGNFDPALMMFRSRELTRFVQRVSAHPTLSKDEDFEFFLMAPWDDFTARRTASPVKDSVVGSIFSSVMNVFGSKIEDTDEWFVSIAAELGSRKELLESLQASATSMVATWRELITLYNIQSQQFHALSKFFGDAEASRCSEDAHAMEANITCLDEFASHVEHSYLDNISDYVREISAIQTVLDRRTELLKEYKNQAKAAEKKGPEMYSKRDYALEQFDKFSDVAREEIKRVMETRKGELERIILGFAQMHRDCFTRTGSDWTNALSAARDGGAAAAAADTTTTTTTTQSLNNAESAGPFSSAVFDGSAASPYATGDD